MPRPGPVSVLVYHPDEAQTYARLIRAPRGRVRVRTAATPTEALAHVEEMDVLYTWGFPTKLLPSANRLRWIQVMGAGVDAFLDAPFPPRVTLTRVVNAEFRGALQKNQLATIRKIRHEISSVVREVLEEGVASGAFKVNNVHGATIALLRLVDVSSWFNPAAGMSPDELADVFVDLSLAMLRASDTP